MTSTQQPLLPRYLTPEQRRQAIEQVRRRWSSMLPGERSDLIETTQRHAPESVRRDRQFFTSLGLHAAVLEYLRSDPDRVVRLGLEGVARSRGNTRGEATRMVDHWERLLVSRDFDQLEVLLTGEGEYETEMRNLSPFAGVLSEEEHRSVREDVLRKKPWLG